MSSPPSPSSSFLPPSNLSPTPASRTAARRAATANKQHDRGGERSAARRRLLSPRSDGGIKLNGSSSVGEKERRPASGGSDEQRWRRITRRRWSVCVATTGSDDKLCDCVKDGTPWLEKMAALAAARMYSCDGAACQHQSRIGTAVPMLVLEKEAGEGQRVCGCLAQNSRELELSQGGEEEEGRRRKKKEEEEEYDMRALVVRAYFFLYSNIVYAGKSLKSPENGRGEDMEKIMA